MFSITLICMGKLKERFYTEAAAEYAKRLRAYCDFQLIELPECRLPEDPNDTQIAQGLQKEAELIRAKLPKGCFFCVLTPEGKLLSSEQLADTLRQAKLGGRSGACFLIGSSFGIAPELKKLADLQLSMSKMTFPHHLARVMALEQLPKRDTERYDLRDTVISLSVSNQPTLSIEFIGSGSTQHTYTESYVDGIYTLTITHNGRVKVTLT